MTIDTQSIKTSLEAELQNILKELETVGRQNPDNPSDWEAVEPDDTEGADEGEVADSMEVYANNKAILEQLELRLAEVKGAIDKINNGTYGKCEVCGSEIEEDRISANPSAKTCKSHMN